ncbi:hypothetical protein K8I85_00175, partial [bacterium]|nr:hypothetical protein [bacterium]
MRLVSVSIRPSFPGLAAALAVALSASPAAATLVGVRSIGWGDPYPVGQMDIYPDCQNPEMYSMVASFRVPALPGGAYGVEVAIDFCTMPVALPEWWQFTEPGGCREGGMTASADFTAGPS